MGKVLTSMSERIGVSADLVRERKKAYDLAVEERDDLIVEAIDSGELSQRAAAKAAKFEGSSAIARILAKPRD